MSPRVPVSVLVPIKNEAENLPRCLGCVQWAHEIFVVDSHSTDGSVEIAQRHGAKVVQFDFNGTWPKKKNWALENLPFRNDWVLILDADEVLPAEAATEIGDAIANTGGIAGYWINRRFFFLGRWLRHSYYPNWNERLTTAETRSGDNEVHEHVIVQGPTARLRCEMDHYAFPSVEVFVEKHNRYSNWEACVAADKLLHGSSQDLSSEAVGRRRRLKMISQRLPFRPLMRFLYIYIWQKGFLDGRDGYYFARLHAIYEFLSVAKTYELRRPSETPQG